MFEGVSRGFRVENGMPCHVYLLAIQCIATSHRTRCTVYRVDHLPGALPNFSVPCSTEGTAPELERDCIPFRAT
jgi:hypothetical protein